MLPFRDASFDLVYSYGVLHHSPDTRVAVAEARRVLRSGGVARVMIYHKYSITVGILWLVHCLGKFRPWRSPKWAVAKFLESPGTKLFSLSEAYQLFREFA